MQKTGNELTYDYDFYALNGLLSFLRLIQEEGGKKVWCQRPNRASFISTFLKIWVNMDLKCVNALNGLLSFLRTSTNGNCTFHIMCQRPKRASFISTYVAEQLKEMGFDECQRPKRASFISTRNTMSKFWAKVRLCQRPKRASFIST